MEQKQASLFQKKNAARMSEKKNAARMSEKISKKVQDSIDGIMRNDPTMTSVDLSSEFFFILILCVEIV